jgi:hypothetical protein
MDENIILIPSYDYGEMDKLEEQTSLLKQMYEAAIRKTDRLESLKEIVDEYETRLSLEFENYEKRFNKWKDLLFKYYKMTRGDIGNTDLKVSYIFPYQLIESNRTLWMLEVDMDNCYEGGVKDHNYTVDDTWNERIMLEEITKEEFVKKACESVQFVIERRLNKITDENNTHCQLSKELE